MNWKRMLACVTGSVDEELLARNEYLVTENRILRNQIKGRVRLTDPARISSDAIAVAGSIRNGVSRKFGLRG